MARSPLTGIEPAPQEPAGRDEAALGPGDTSDSGSDVAGRVDRDGGDPVLPVDLALAEPEAARGDRPVEDEPSAADIGVDRVFVPGGEGDLAVDDPAAVLDDATANDPLDDEDEAADADDTDAPDENEREIAATTKGVPKRPRRRATAPKTVPGATAVAPIPAPPPDPPLPNPEPDVPAQDPEAPNDEGDAELRKPGRDPAAAAGTAVPAAAATEPPPKRRRFVPPRRW